MLAGSVVKAEYGLDSSAGPGQTVGAMVEEITLALMVMLGGCQVRSGQSQRDIFNNFAAAK